MIEIKKKLHSICVERISQKLFQINEDIKKAQESANSDTKSSMGDKYETGRAMAQLEIEKSTIQKVEFESQLQILDRIANFRNTEIVTNGSLVICNTGTYYISTSAGLITLENEKYYAVSAISPLGKELIGLKKGGKLLFNGKNIEVLEIM